MAKTQGGIIQRSMTRISGKLSMIVIPPLLEQLRIAKHLAELYLRIEKLHSVEAQTAVELDALLPSILDKAFRGHL